MGFGLIRTARSSPFLASRPLCIAVPRSGARIRRANGGKTSGCFDVLVWHEGKHLFIESKRESKDSILTTQKAWIEAALRCDVPLDSLLICEWNLEPMGYDPDLFQSKDDVEHLRTEVEKRTRRMRSV
jgi:hypothetical protein